MMCATREDDVSPRWQYASEDVDLYSRNSAHRHQPKGGQSCADGTRSSRDNTHGCFGMFRGVNAWGDAHNNNNPIKYSRRK